MAENNLNRVFIKPTDEQTDETGAEEERFERRLAEKMAAGLKSGEFERAVKAYAGLKRVSDEFERAVKTYAMFDRVTKKLFWEGKRA